MELSSLSKQYLCSPYSLSAQVNLRDLTQKRKKHVHWPLMGEGGRGKQALHLRLIHKIEHSP